MSESMPQMARSVPEPPVPDTAPCQVGVNLPDDCEFTYYLVHEQWYAPSLLRNGTLDKKPALMVSASSPEGGCQWEFEVMEYDLAGPTLRIKPFADSFVAFVQIPAFFEPLAVESPKRLADVAAILKRLGAQDRTERKMPLSHIPMAERAVIRCRIQGIPGVTHAEREQGVWLIPGIDRIFQDSQITDLIQILSLGGDL